MKLKQPSNATTYVALSRIHGKGLFARTHIPAGSIIGWVEGVPKQSDGSYVLWLNEQEGIEVTCDLKYINHCDEPNACYYDDRSVMALRDILPNQEITHDYASNDW